LITFIPPHTGHFTSFFAISFHLPFIFIVSLATSFVHDHFVRYLTRQKAQNNNSFDNLLKSYTDRGI